MGSLRSARCPSLPSSLMSALRSIPHHTELPGAPNGLAMSPEGELVSPLDPVDHTPPAGLAEAPVKPRRARLGAGAAISGLALGVDSSAHVGALAGIAPPVAVLAGGCDQPYPPSKRGLYAAVRSAGAA